MITDMETFLTSLKKVKALIFDLDGTLIDLNMPWNRIKDHFKERHQKEYNEELPSHRFHANFKFIREKYGSEALQYYSKYLEQSEMDNVIEGGPFPLFLINEGLDKLKELIDPTTIFGICSSNYHATIEKLMKIYNFDELFSFILGRDDVTDAKPDPEGLLSIVKNYSLEKDKIIFIGDADVDKKAAEAAEIPYIHVDQLQQFLK